MNIRPLGRRVLVRLLDAEKRSPGGIVLPNGAGSERALQAEVLELGTDDVSEVRKGDVVLIPRSGGTELEQDRRSVRIIRVTDILAVVKTT